MTDAQIQYLDSEKDVKTVSILVMLENYPEISQIVSFDVYIGPACRDAVISLP